MSSCNALTARTSTCTLPGMLHRQKQKLFIEVMIYHTQPDLFVLVGYEPKGLACAFLGLYIFCYHQYSGSTHQSYPEVWNANCVWTPVNVFCMCSKMQIVTCILQFTYAWLYVWESIWAFFHCRPLCIESCLLCWWSSRETTHCHIFN